MSERTVKGISWHLPGHWWYLSADKIKAVVKGKFEPLSAHTWAAKGAEQRQCPAMSEAARRFGGRGVGCLPGGRREHYPTVLGSTACSIDSWPCAGLLCLWERICAMALTGSSLKSCFLPVSKSSTSRGIGRSFTKLLTVPLTGLQRSWEVALQATEPKSQFWCFLSWSWVGLRLCSSFCSEEVFLGSLHPMHSKSACQNVISWSCFCCQSLIGIGQQAGRNRWIDKHINKQHYHIYSIFLGKLS